MLHPLFFRVTNHMLDDSLMFDACDPGEDHLSGLDLSMALAADTTPTRSPHHSHGLPST
jgi:hypothetical protein